MAQDKCETINMRVTSEFKRLLKLAAEREQRSQTNLLEKLLTDHCRHAGIIASIPEEPAPQSART
ncbi:hypothetical protein AzCIB_1422 [Azoarcus sp. CIB]|nr:hypothetical protein AzCIB_1422 [Azoarcus sp. CIB]